MAVVPQPIELPDALTELETIISSIRLKNTTLINYYIHPDPIPNQIAAFEPRVDALSERLTDLKSLSIPKLTLLLNDAPCMVASYLLPIAEQLADSARLFQDLFINHYDRTLVERKPYINLWQRLKYLDIRLKQFMTFHMQNPNKRPAAQLHPPPSATAPSFCTSAVAFLNNVDRGRIQSCLPTELTAENKARLRAEGGVCLWWECTDCAFRLRFHVSNSAGMNINSTSEVRKHDDVDAVEYRSSWLAKCHLYHPGRDEQVQERERRRSSTTKPASKGKKSSSISVNTTGVGGVKYGCLFCFVKGKILEPKESAFSNAKDFVSHIGEKHIHELPAGILLQCLKVAINGKSGPGVQRWDLNYI